MHIFLSHFSPRFSVFGFNLNSQLILLFSSFLLLFMDSTELFDTIHGSHCTILTNFHLYLQYFQQKIFSFSKISRYQTNPWGENSFLSPGGKYLRPPVLNSPFLSQPNNKNDIFSPLFFLLFSILLLITPTKNYLNTT